MYIIALLFIAVGGKPFEAFLIGLGTAPAAYIVPANSQTFAISFKLSAAEYIFGGSIAALVNKQKPLPGMFWGVTCPEISSLDSFVSTVSPMIRCPLGKQMDGRKQILFHNLYESEGEISVGQLSVLTSWSSRQINRYFQRNVGLSLKTYCNILRFRASFDHLHQGKLFPDNGYFDQPHFIRDVHKFSGTSPKHLAKIKKTDLYNYLPWIVNNFALH